MQSGETIPAGVAGATDKLVPGSAQLTCSCTSHPTPHGHPLLPSCLPLFKYFLEDWYVSGLQSTKEQKHVEHSIEISNLKHTAFICSDVSFEKCMSVQKRSHLNSENSSLSKHCSEFRGRNSVWGRKQLNSQVWKEYSFATKQFWGQFLAAAWATACPQTSYLMFLSLGFYSCERT